MTEKPKKLIIRGGGVSALLGALAVLLTLRDNRMLGSLEEVVGVSAGGFAALALALGMPVEEYKNIVINEVSFADFLKEDGMRAERFFQKKIGERLAKGLESLIQGALYKPGRLQEMQEITNTFNAAFNPGGAYKISDFLKPDFEGYKNITFLQLDQLMKNDTIRTKLGLKHLHLVGSRITDPFHPEEVIFNHTNPLTQNIPIVRALHASMALPGAYSPVLLPVGPNEAIEPVSDGGLTNELPIYMFDKNGKPDMETIGIAVVNREDYPAHYPKEKPATPAPSGEESILKEILPDSVKAAINGVRYFTNKTFREEEARKQDDKRVICVTPHEPGLKGMLDIFISPKRKEAAVNKAGKEAMTSPIIQEYVKKEYQELLNNLPHRDNTVVSEKKTPKSEKVTDKGEKETGWRDRVGGQIRQIFHTKKPETKIASAGREISADSGNTVRQVSTLC